MKKSIIIILLLPAILFFLLSACSNSKDIDLSDITYAPEYFHNNMLFGTDPKSLTELNKYIIETGVIDTNSEQRPKEVAFIFYKKSLCELKKVGIAKISDNEISEEYANNEIHIKIKLTYKPIQFNNGDSFTTGSCEVSVGTKKRTLSIAGKKGVG